MRKAGIVASMAVVLAGLLTPSVPPASASTTGVYTGAQSDTCQADLEHVDATYTQTTVDLQVTTRCATNPATDANWLCNTPDACGITTVFWDIDVNGDDLADYEATLGHDEGTPLLARMTRLDTQTVACMGTPAFTLGPANLLEARFAASCIGSPPSLRIQVDYQWDPSPSSSDFCDCTDQYGPEGGGWTTPASRGPGVHSGYLMLAADGSVYAFGDAHYQGAQHFEHGRAVDIESSYEGDGYFVLYESGLVFRFGDTGFQFPRPPEPWSPFVSLQQGERAVSLSVTPNDQGYVVFTDRGRAIPVGFAAGQGDLSGQPLNGPVLDSNIAPLGMSYYMTANDGGVFAYGPDASFQGSMGGRRLNAPVVGMAPDPDGTGYWLVAGDGGVFSFEAPFMGSMGGKRLNQPMVGMVPYGDGYLMVASDGGVFDFSNKPFAGSLADNPPPAPIVAITPIRT